MPSYSSKLSRVHPNQPMINSRRLVSQNMEPIKEAVNTINNRIAKVKASDELLTQIQQLKSLLELVEVGNMTRVILHTEETLELYTKILKAWEERKPEFNMLYAQINAAILLLEEQQDGQPLDVPVEQTALVVEELSSSDGDAICSGSSYLLEKQQNGQPLDVPVEQTALVVEELSSSDGDAICSDSSHLLYTAPVIKSLDFNIPKLPTKQSNAKPSSDPWEAVIKRIQDAFDKTSKRVAEADVDEMYSIMEYMLEAHNVDYAELAGEVEQFLC